MRLLIRALTLAAVAPLLFRAPFFESDLWWHLAAGREILARGAVPLTDPFSFTFAGKEWIGHEWLWDLLHWLVYRVEPEAVAWLTAFVLLAILAVAYAIGRTLEAPEAACGLAVFVAAVGAHWFSSIRPLSFTDLFVGIVVLTRKRRWAPVLWPILVVLWVNLHGGFVFGLGAIGLLVLLRTLGSSVAARRLVVDPRAWISLFVCLVVWVLNPWGWHIAGYPLDYLTATGYREIAEWHAPEIGLDPRSYEGQFWWTALLAAVGGARAWRKDAYPVALAAVTLAMAATSRRFVPLFLIVAAPLVAVLFAEIGARAALGWPRARLRAAAVAIAVVAVLTAAGLSSGVRVGPGLLESWTGSDRFPHGALRYLRALGSPERVLNAYDWGGYLMLHAPEVKVFFDSRANTVYDEAILRDYQALNEGRGDAGAIAARYAPDAALVQPGPIVAALERAAPPWTKVYDDGAAVVLLPPGSPLLDRPLPVPEAALAGEPALEMILATRAVTARDLDGAARHLERAIELDPLLVRAYAELARVDLARGLPADAGRVIERGIAAYPRQGQRFRFYEGQAYLEAGYLPFARAAFRQAYPRGPSGPRAFIAGLIAEVDRRIAVEAGAPLLGTP